MKRLLFLIFLGAVGAYFFRLYCYEGVYVASESMEPTLPKDLHVMVNKFSVKFKKPKRGDVILFDSPIDPKKGLIKRVIAMEGEVLEIRDKKVYLDGRRLDEPYVQLLSPETMFVGDNWPATKIPEGMIFVMGDNRDVSGDSRDWKSPSGKAIPFLPLSAVKGIVLEKK